MDAVTQSLLKEFVASQQISATGQPEQFEHFINYIVAFELLPEEFDIEKIATGAGEFGLDGIAIIVNDTLIEDEEQVDDIAQSASVLTVSLNFMQAKTSSSFDAGELSKFFLAVQDFFNPTLALVQNEQVQSAHRAKQRLYDHAGKFLRGLPRLSMFFATTGSWVEDKNLVAIRDAHTSTLRAKNIFDAVDFYPIDAAKAQKLYFQTKNSYKVTINFPNTVTLPKMPGVSESYLGILAVPQYLGMIMDEHGEVRKRLFFDNVRDYQGDTAVNKSIAETIASEKRIEFPLRNNGVTIVTRKLKRVGVDFYLEDFQIVNGCQTSHVIAKAWSATLGEFYIPVKLISTEDDDVTRNVIIASNSQNEIDQDSFWGLAPIHKLIEIFFTSKKADGRLYYERRPGQYNSSADVEKVRIITRDGLLKAHASMFSNDPHRVGRYYKDLLPMIGKDIFNPQHELFSYYTAALAIFRLEWLFRNKRLDPKYKAFRYQLIMALRLMIENEEKLDPKRSLTQKYCEAIDAVLVDVDKSQAAFEKVIPCIDKAVSSVKGGTDRRTAKMKDMRDALIALF